LQDFTANQATIVPTLQIFKAGIVFAVAIIVPTLQSLCKS